VPKISSFHQSTPLRIHTISHTRRVTSKVASR